MAATVAKTVSVGIASGAVTALPKKGLVKCTVIGANRVWYSLNGDATAAVVDGDDMGVLLPNVPKTISWNTAQYFIAETGATKVHFQVNAFIE